MDNPLDRFLKAQEADYALALSEIKSGQKRSHWMWYIFPQFKDLGYSYNAKYYAINSLEEAKDYLYHSVLGYRIKEISNELLLLKEDSIGYILGSPDDKKLQSSMTLFAEVDQSEGNVFMKVIHQYYNGRLDEKTLLILNE